MTTWRGATGDPVPDRRHRGILHAHPRRHAADGARRRQRRPRRGGGCHGRGHEPPRGDARAHHPAGGRRALDAAAGRSAHADVQSGLRLVVRRRRGRCLRRVNRCPAPLQVVSVTPTERASGSRSPSPPPRASSRAGRAMPRCHMLGALHRARRAGPADAAGRDGSVTIDLRGFPRAPASVARSAYADAPDAPRRPGPRRPRTPPSPDSRCGTAERA